MGLCRSCHAPVMWARGRKGADIILDPDPLPNGNIIFVDGDQTRYLGFETKKEFPDWETRDRYASHFSTCPEADEWRNP